MPNCATRWYCCVMSRYRTALYTAPANSLLVIRKEMTHETSLVLLFGQLWPDFRIQLTVNQWLSSLHRLVVPIETFPDRGRRCPQSCSGSLSPINNSFSPCSLYSRTQYTGVIHANVKPAPSKPQRCPAGWRSCRSGGRTDWGREPSSGLTAGALSSAPA